jgi:hypothetical protein
MKKLGVLLVLVFLLMSCAMPEEIIWGTIVSPGVITYSLISTGKRYLTIIVRTDEGEALPVLLDSNETSEEAVKCYKLTQGEKVRIVIHKRIVPWGITYGALLKP